MISLVIYFAVRGKLVVGHYKKAHLSSRGGFNLGVLSLMRMCACYDESFSVDAQIRDTYLLMLPRYVRIRLSVLF